MSKGSSPVDKIRQLYERAVQSLPMGTSSNARVFPGYELHPIFIERGKGSKTYDVEGNEYIDYIQGFGSCILGHRHPKIMEAIRQQLEEGTMFCTLNELEVKAAEKLREIVPCADMCRFVQSGTEATMHAIRLARGYTGKDKIIKFEGHYHGHHDYVCVSCPEMDYNTWGSSIAPNKIPVGPGIPASTLESVIVLPWNNVEVLEKTIRRRGNEVAGVIMEPVMGNGGLIFPEEGYLEAVRELTADNDIVLIFDEVVTGFRMALGGAQEHFGVRPDLATYSKAFGGGAPISAFCGKKEIMEKLSATPSGVFHEGTYNANSLCLAAAYATMQELSSNDGMYKDFYRIGNKLINGLRDAAERTGHKILIPGFAGFLVMLFTEKQKLKDWRDLRLNADFKKFIEFAWELIKRGVFQAPGPFERWHVSMAHNDEDVEKTIAAAEEAFKTMKP